LKAQPPAPNVRPQRQKVKTYAYEVAEHLRTPEEMAAYLDPWLEEAPNDVVGMTFEPSRRKRPANPS
jgi:DNA-binding phage protein